jgi:hypothetical protein
MTEITTLYLKDGFLFVRNEKNNYDLSFQIDNDSIILEKILEFNLVKLIYDLNSDIYEKVNVEIINEDEAVANLLMKHLFEELGLPQRFSYLHIRKMVGVNNIKFVSQTIKSGKPEGMPLDAELMPIESMICNCDIITPHKIQFTCNVLFEPIMNVPHIAEKLVGIILYKIFKRVKQFIENVRM